MEVRQENVERGWVYAYRDRMNKKREFRCFWIVRINAAAGLVELPAVRLWTLGLPGIRE